LLKRGVVVQMKSDFIIALTQLAAERNLPREIVLSAIEAALISAYKRDSVAAGQDISVKLDPNTGDVSVFTVRTVAEEIEDPDIQIGLADARKIRAEAEIGDVVPTGELPHSAGRIAAQTAKQVVIQRLREAERDLVFREFADKEGEVFTVTVQRMEPKQIIVELGRAEAILPSSEQAPYERCRVGSKIKVLLKTVRESAKGPEMIVSRADKDLVRRLFEMEVPEIYNGAVEIVGIAREPGSRSKVAVHAKQDGVDAVGSCVGLRGIRIQNIVNELHGEKIDVVQWSKDPGTYISNSLSPSSVMRVELDPDTGAAVAVVPDRQLSLAIGKEGQNARLAARLTSWNVDIKSNVEVEAEAVARAAEEAAQRQLEEEQAAAEAERAAQETVTAEEPAEAVAEEAAVEPIAAEESAEAVAEVVAEPIAAEQAAVEVEEAAVEPIAAEEPAEVVAEAAAEPIAAEQAASPVEETVAEVEAELEAPVPEGVLEDAAQVEEAVEEEPAEGVLIEEPAPIDLPEILIPELDELVPEEAPAAVESTSIQDLPEDVWSLRRNTPAEPGVIRFAEDIDELRGFGQRRGRGGGRKGRGGRRTKARRR
jgi:N utilization substance protein A